jgi:hypothetical protein
MNHFKKLFNLIANLFTIVLIGFALAKLRVKVKYLYFILLGASAICFGVGVGAVCLAILGFEDVGGNIYKVLLKYSPVFIVLAFSFTYLMDRIIIYIQQDVLSLTRIEKINFYQVLYALAAGSALIVYLFITPDLVRTSSFFILTIGSFVYGLKTKIT